MSGERIETAGEYVPTTEDVEVYFALGLVEYSPGNGHALDVAHDGFRRWLSQVTAEAEARGAREADAALTKALGQRDAVAVTAERMTSYARQAEAVLREVAALHTNVYHRKMYAEFWACGECDYPATGPDDYCPTATLARAEQTGADR